MTENEILTVAVEIAESKTHNYAYIMKKKRELYAFQKEVNAKLKETTERQEEFENLCLWFAKTNVPKAHDSKDVMRFLTQYEGLSRFMAHTETPDLLSSKEHYEFYKEVAEKWNVKDVQDMLDTCCHAFKMTPFKMFCKLVVDDARQYCKLYESKVAS